MELKLSSHHWEEILFSKEQGSGYAVDYYDHILDEVEPYSFRSAYKYYNPGATTNLSNFFNKELLLLGKRKGSDFEALFYFPVQETQQHYIKSVFIMENTVLYIKTGTDTGKEFNFINGIWTIK